MVDLLRTLCQKESVAAEVRFMYKSHSPCSREFTPVIGKVWIEQKIGHCAMIAILMVT